MGEPSLSGYRDRNSTADRALLVLHMFSRDRLEVSAADVASELEVARSSAYRYVQSLTDYGFLEEAQPGRYRLGRRVLELALLARQGYGLSEIARPLMRRLAVEIRETVLLTRLAGSSVVCLEREEPVGQTVRISYEAGQLMPINAGASAVVLLAWLEQDTIDVLLAGRELERFTPATITDKQELLLRLKQTAAQGYGLSRGEVDSNVVGIAAPIRNSHGQVHAAIGVAGLASRLTEARIPDIITAVRAVAEEITARLALA